MITSQLIKSVQTSRLAQNEASQTPKSSEQATNPEQRIIAQNLAEDPSVVDSQSGKEQIPDAFDFLGQVITEEETEKLVQEFKGLHKQLAELPNRNHNTEHLYSRVEKIMKDINRFRSSYPALENLHNKLSEANKILEAKLKLLKASS